MATWLYQLAENEWSRTEYRIKIWENKCLTWDESDNLRVPRKSHPERGDTLILFYAKKMCKEPGFHGWGIILEWTKSERMSFSVVAPSDQLKMRPWGDVEAMALADQVRDPNPHAGTIFLVEDTLARTIAAGITSWLHT